MEVKKVGDEEAEDEEVSKWNKEKKSRDVRRLLVCSEDDECDEKP